ncbi:MAG: glycosyltransferase [Paludibacteraceae bacterium]|nr:glycosyltransferase [Paludibacteraceae bacterium]
MAGLFVQKHAEAVRAQGVDVRVLSTYSWRELWREWRDFRRSGWMPDIVQLNVIQKQGLLALWLKRRYHIPYVIVEHWSGYLPENGQFMRMPAFKRRLYARIAREASVLLGVSNRLIEAMRACGVANSDTRKINNVVDDFFFEASGVKSQESGRKTILQVSCFDERAKNVKGLLRAAKRLSEKRQDWQLVLVGDGIDYKETRAYAQELQIPEQLLRWTGELTPREVSNEFDNADIFVLPSRYENAPVVISESLAKGVPVVATKVGGIPEMVNADCGILIESNDDAALVQALQTMLDHYQEYDTKVIRQAGEPYSFAKVGRQLKDIYEQVQAR